MIQLLPQLPRPLRRHKLVRALLTLAPGQAVQATAFDYGARAYVDLRDSTSRSVFLHRSFWPEFARLGAAFMHHGGVMFDVGANLGLCSFGIASLLPPVPVEFHLFEANPSLIPVLRRSIGLQRHGQFKIINGGVTEHPGTSFITGPPGDWVHGWAHDTRDVNPRREHAVVPNIILDDYIEGHGINHIVFLKMDIEGWEPLALRGMSRALAGGRVESLFVEIIGPVLSRVNFNPEDVLLMMEGWGFDAYSYRLPSNQAEREQHRWSSVPINNTQIQFALVPRAVPNDFHGDVLFLHRDTTIATRVRSSIRRS